MSEQTTWSHTRLTSYLTCPCAYKLHYLQGEPVVATDPMRHGSEFHEAIERYAMHCWRGGNKPVKTSFDAGRAIAAGYPDLEEDIARWVDGTLWEWGCILPGETAPVEVMYQAELPNGDLFRGRVDLLQRYSEGAADDPFAESADLWVVTDYKTGWATYPEGRAPLQLLGYAWLVQQAFPEARQFELRIDSVRAPWSPKPWPVSGSLDWVTDSLVGIAERIKQDDEFAPNVGTACANCGVVLACPHARSAMVGGLREEPGQIARQVALCEALADAGKRALKEAVKQGGPVAVSATEAWGWEQRETVEVVSPREFADMAENLGLDPWQFAGVTGTQFAKAAKEVGEDGAALLARCTRRKTSNSFKTMRVADAVDATDKPAEEEAA